MLQNIGDKLHGQRWLSYLVLGVLALIFVMWGATGFSDPTGVGATNAATVNGEKISADEFNRAWQAQQARYAQLLGGNMDEAQRRLLQEQLLDGFIRERAVMSRTQELGFRVSTQQLVDALRDEPAFQLDGQFDRNQYYSRLAAVGITPAQFEADRRRQLQMNQLGIAIGGTEFVTPGEAARLTALETEEREVRYALLTADKFATGPAFDAAAIEAAYKANEAQYMEPESAKLAYAELTLADVTAQVTVTDEQLRDRYETEKDRFVVAETRQVRHILLPVEEGKDDAAVKAQADALAQRARGGEDFAKLARENSKDVGSAAQGGDLGWVDRTALEPSLTDTLFALKKGEAGGPVRTRFGWHVVKVDDIREGHSQSFDEAREELEAEVRRQLAADEFGNRQEQLQSRIERGGSGFDELVKTFGLTRGEIADFRRGAGGAPLGSDAELNAEVFSDRVAKQNAVGGPRALGEDRLVIFQVQEYRPAKLKPLDEVRADVVARLTRERGTEEARKVANEALPKLESGEDLAKLVASRKIPVEPAKFYGRGDPTLPAEVRDFAFNAVRPAPGKPLRKVVNLEDGAALVEVTSTRVPSGPEAELQKAQLVQRDMQRRGSNEVDAYVAELMAKAKVRKNTQVFE